MSANYNEPDKTFRDKWFYGKDRELLAGGKWDEVDLGDIAENDRNGRIRQAYLDECRGHCDEAQRIYNQMGVDRIASCIGDAPFIDDIMGNDG